MLVQKKVGSTLRCPNAKTKTVLESGCKNISKNNHFTYSLHILAISTWPIARLPYRAVLINAVCPSVHQTFQVCCAAPDTAQ